MAGKRGKSGRRPIPDVLKINSGRYRPDQSGDPKDKPEYESKLRRPPMTQAAARAFWEKYVPMLVESGVATAADAPRLQAMCEAWALLRLATKEVNKYPLDRDYRASYAEYSKLFATAASEFGMNPADRSRIRLEKPAKPAIKGRRRG